MLNLSHIIAKPSAQARGFSIVEIAVVLAILAVVLTFALPGYTTWLENTRIRSVAESVLSGVQQTRAIAVKNNASVRFTLTGNDWAIGCVTVTAACPVVVAQFVAEGSSTSVSATVTPVGQATITFNPLGMSVLPANSFNQIDIASTVTSTRALRIEAGVGGSIRLCDPAFAIAATPRGCN